MRSRKLSIMIAVSAIGHGLAYAGLALLEPATPPVEPGQFIEITIEPAPTPMAQPPDPGPGPAPGDSVGLSSARPIEETEPAQTPDTGARRRQPRGPSAPAVAAAPAEPAATAPATSAAPASLLSMRGTTARAQPELRASSGPNLSPSSAAAAIVASRLSGSTPGSAPESAIDTRSPLQLPDAPRIPGSRGARTDHGPMIPDGNGTFRYDHAAFTAQVARDGRVTLEDKPSVQPYLEGPCLECVKRDINKYTADPWSGEFLDLMALLPKVGVRFDITDYVMRRIGDDPYNHAKAKFLDETRDRREQMWHAESEERLREALQILPAELARIWAHEGWTPAERRRVLFDLWDECAETGAADRVRLGQQIRVTIVAFIRKQLPADSEHAYSADELRRLNARRASKSAFAPYGPRTGEDSGL